MSPYRGRYAELYDHIYRDKDYAGEAAFVDACFKRFGDQPQRLLELACGTGRHAEQLARMGYEILATDASEDLIAWARARRSAPEGKLYFQRVDMLELSRLGDYTADAAICLFDSIGYVGTNEALAKVFQGVRQRVPVGGLFVFDFWHAAPMLTSFDPVRVIRFPTPQGEAYRISETELLVDEQLARVHYTILELNDDGTWQRTEESQTNRYFLKEEMAGLLTTNGFEPVAFLAGYSEESEIRHDTWHVLTVARRAE